MAARAGEDILSVLRRLVIQKFDVAPEVLRDDQSFEEMGLDSLRLVNLIFQAENHFSVRIDFELASKTPTLRGLPTSSTACATRHPPAAWTEAMA
jgi:acyl carrier protein